MNISEIRAARIALQHGLASHKRLTTSIIAQHREYLDITKTYLKTARAQISRVIRPGAELQYINTALNLLMQPDVNPIYIQNLIQKSINLLYVLEGTLQRKQRRSS